MLAESIKKNGLYGIRFGQKADVPLDLKSLEAAVRGARNSMYHE